jgi:hypothetical protein
MHVQEGAMERDNSNFSEIREKFDLARNEIKRRKSDQALEIIESVRDDVAKQEDPQLLAEHRLLIAEARGIKGDRTAESLFTEALALIASLDSPQASLEMRANEHFADYLINFASRPLDGRKHLLAANQVAIREGLESESVRLGMKTVLTY